MPTTDTSVVSLDVPLRMRHTGNLFTILLLGLDCMIGSLRVAVHIKPVCARVAF